MRQKLFELSTAVKQAREGIEEAVDQILMPQIESTSTSIYQVRTGQYSQGWTTTPLPNGVRISNTTPYATPLEFGWTLRGGGFRPSPGVLHPTVLMNISRVWEAFESWLRRTAQLS